MLKESRHTGGNARGLLNSSGCGRGRWKYSFPSPVGCFAGSVVTAVVMTLLALSPYPSNVEAAAVTSPADTSATVSTVRTGGETPKDSLVGKEPSGPGGDVAGQAGKESPRREASTDTTIYRVSASSLKSVVKGGERVIELSGGVRIEHRTTTITSRRGTHYPDKRHTYLYEDVHVVDGTMETRSDVGEYIGDEDIVKMKGNVVLEDRGFKLLCDLGEYNRATRVAVFTGNLHIEDSTRVMYADTIVYDRNKDTAEAFGHVVLVDQVEDYSIAGTHAIYSNTTKTAVVDRRPILTYDLKSDEKGTVRSVWMKFDTQEKVGYAIENVRMKKGDTRAKCDSAVIFNDENRVELFGHAEATNGQSSMSGDRMVIYYNQDEVREVVLPDGGMLAQKPPEKSAWRERSWIAGDSINIYLSAEKVDSVKIVGSCKAMYYPAESEENKVSNNYSTGDTMYFRFADEELSYVRISGRASGLYKFMNLKERETIDSLSSTIDSSLVYRNFAREAESVSYKANVIEYFADSEEIVLSKMATVEYQDKSLSADRIDFNSRLDVLEAVGNPVLEEAGQKMFGDQMGYDMDSETGVVIDGSTKYEEGYYLGEELYKVGKDVLKVYNSTYTTCDLKRPHYSFRASKMKVYVNDKIVSGPITLYIGEIPIFYLPFFANSIRRDRHSGFLQPNFDIGINSREGRFIRGFGYYWATNDYTDFTLRGDFNENRSFRLHLGNRYKLRYVLDGSVDVNYYRDLSSKRNEWTFESRHSQTFSKSASFTSNLRFVSSDRAQIAMDQSEDTRRILDRKIYSSATFRKSWGGASLNLSATRNQVLNVSSPTQIRVSTTMPSFSLSLPRTSLWFGEKHPSGERGIWERFLSSIHFSPNLKAVRKTEESEARRKATLTAGSSAGFGRQARLLFLDISPSVNVRWDYLKVLYDEVNPEYQGTIYSSSSTNYKNEFALSFSSGLGTKLYGTFYPRIGPLVGVRHTINPSLSYSYTPKLTERQRENRSVSYSLRNVIDLKVLSGGKEVKKNGVITWNLNGGYDPDLPKDRRFSRISSSMRANPVNNLSMSLNNYYDPYEKKILSTDLSIGFSLGGSFSYPGEWKAEKRERIAAAEGMGKAGSPITAGGARSWTFRLNYKYSISGEGVMRRTTSSVDLGGQISITRGWRISYHGYYDIESRRFREQYYSLKRDLHCWQASFIHRRFGNDWSYYFQIAIKAHPEIMWEKGVRGLQSFMGF